MKTETIECSTCGLCVDKPAKEVKRRRLLGKLLYCSLKCAGVANFQNFGDSIGKSSPEHMAAMVSKAADANRRYTIEEQPFQEHIRRARKRGKDFDLDIQYLMDIWKRQEGRCAITRVPMRQIGTHGDWLTLASLDRRDSRLGYIKGNVQFVACAVNYAKRDATDDALHTFLALVIENYVAPFDAKNG